LVTRLSKHSPPEVTEDTLFEEKPNCTKLVVASRRERKLPCPKKRTSLAQGESQDPRHMYLQHHCERKRTCESEKGKAYLSKMAKVQQQQKQPNPVDFHDALTSHDHLK